MHINELFSLKGKVALVIGGAGKIGFPMSEALAEAGARVYIASRNTVQIQAASNKLRLARLDTHSVRLDQADEKNVISCLNFITADSKTPDILINCGVERPMKKFFDDTVETWDRSMEVNSRGLFISCRVFGKAMAKQNSGSIINVASIYGMVAPDMNLYEGSNFETEPDYPYTKGGMIMFSKYLSSYLAKSKVRVNCIAPGGYHNNQAEPFHSLYIRKVPLGRMAYHDDLKGATVFLASDASSYITGSVIPIDGGFVAI